jgi:hypothetical protein
MRLVSENEYSQFKKAVDALPPANKEDGFNELVSEL